MGENHLFSTLKARLIDLEKQFEEKDKLLKVANSKVEKLWETISVRKQTINERDSTILSIQNLEAWHEGACEAAGLQLNWQEGYKKLWSAYSNQAKELKAFKQADTFEGISNQFADLRKTISAQYQIIKQRDELIAGMNLTLRKKGLTIAEKDLLISSVDPNVFPLYADIKVAHLSGLVYVDLVSSVKEVQVDITGKTINDHVISFLTAQLIRYSKRYDYVNAACLHQMKIESLKKPLYEIALKVRAREIENAVASRTGSTPREKITGPGNHAAHGADALADAQMVLKTDSKTDVGRVISGKREQFEFTYLVPPEIVLKFGSVWNGSYFPNFIQLLNLYQDLKIWRSEGIGILEFPIRRYSIKRLVNRIYPSEELNNAEAFDADEAAIKEWNELWDISRELRDEHRKFRRENNPLLRKYSHRRSLEETSRRTNALRSATPNSPSSIVRRDSRRSLK
ncbi:uncharacterized protein EAE97_003648 [Botrytis byssoidea]|uniref:Uncharacterized protein n=1 Tax=Botrytis byssoidea TaxID=139641 RepID=A0A9P5IS19_9HELO|nr:uncharacterized protein EAE97_003648 [Botrytis byssoidea]KAF7948237.1 hypothetical protein EAE97_003648 [Botrytis byssoidea]